MAWFRRKKTLDLGTFVAPEAVPPASFDDLIDEGVLISAAGVRLAVKNLMILKSLRDHADYDEARYEEAVRQELANLADEKDADADRLAKVRVEAYSRPGLPTHHSDYRLVDSGALLMRERLSRGLADRLRQLSEDREYVGELVALAQEMAWGEVAASVTAKAHEATRPVDDKYWEYRDDRLLRLLGDLSDLEAERG